MGADYRIHKFQMTRWIDILQVQIDGYYTAAPATKRDGQLQADKFNRFAS